MKKTGAILFLIVYLFNSCGYQLFFSFAEDLADRQVIASLDENNYDESALIQIKLPLNIPYMPDHKNYERCNGQFELNGVQYNYVKRSIQNDTIYLYCVPNQKKTELINTKTQYAKQACDLPPDKKAGQSNAKRNIFSGEYNARLLHYSFFSLVNSPARSALFNNNNTLTGFITSPLQPPDMI